MICMYCGKEIEDGTAFCPYCGKSTAAVSEAAPAAGKSSGPRKQLAPVAAVAAAAVVVCIGAAVHKPTINLNKYVTLSAEGYNTVGTLDVEFDTDRLEKDYGKKLAKNFQKTMKNHKDDTFGLSSVTATLYDGAETDFFVDYCATGHADKTRGLKNGDVVTYTWDDSADAAEALFGVKLKYSDITYTVSGLEKVNVFDAFDGVAVEFSGSAPNGSATVNSTPVADEAKSLYYTLDKSSGLSNGDTVTVTVSSHRDDFSDCIETYGSVPAEAQKTFTVQGLDEYITSEAGMTDSVLESLKRQAEDVMASGIANNSDSETETFGGMDYLGNYIQTLKNGKIGKNTNIVTLVYKVYVHDRFEGKEGDIYDANNEYYWRISFNNICKDGDGNLAGALNDYDTGYPTVTFDSGIRDGLFGTRQWSHRGHETLDDLYREVINTKAEDYNHEDNVTDK